MTTAKATPITAASAAEWMRRYGEAWVRRDPALAVPLFTEDAVYHQTPFGPHYRGHAAIERYWADITRDEAEVTFQAGQPIVDGRTAVCEWWVTMTERGEWTTLPGCVILLFDESGACSELREYWHQQPGAEPAFDGWGAVAR
jgi:SnoaL-like domain